MFRIGYGGIGIESSSFAPLRATLGSFRTCRGEEMLEPWFVEASNAYEVSPIPLFRAAGTPSGEVTGDTWEHLWKEFESALVSALPLDGLLIRTHGATVIEGGISGERELLRRVRKVCGPDLPITLALDLHANLPQDIADYCSIVTAYRTAPHRDAEATVIRALRVLANALRENLKPVTSIVKLPLVLPGERVVTETEPARSLYKRLSEFEQRSGLLDASILVGFGWSDVEYAGMAAIVVAESDSQLAENCALELAHEIWKLRHDFQFEGEVATPLEAIRIANQSPGTLFISDSGDNISAGAPGDSVLMLELLLNESRECCLFSPLVDEPALQACFSAGVGATLKLSLGGKVSSGPEVAVTAKVRALGTRDGLRSACVQVEHVTVVLLEARAYFYIPEDFRTLGIDLREYRIVVLKLGYLFSELRDLAQRSIMALSAGASALQLERFEYRRLRRPICPLDVDAAFRPRPRFAGDR